LADNVHTQRHLGHVRFYALAGIGGRRDRQVRRVIRGGPLAAWVPADRTAAVMLAACLVLTALGFGIGGYALGRRHRTAIEALTARCPVSWNGAHACRLQQGHSGKHVSGSGWNYAAADDADARPPRATGGRR
jgi:hypothetical protein